LTTRSQASAFSSKQAKSMLRGYAVALFFVAIALVLTLMVQHLSLSLLISVFRCGHGERMVRGHGCRFFCRTHFNPRGRLFLRTPPLYSFAINATAETYFAAFVVCALVASWVSSVQKQSEDALLEARDQLEIRVSERTTELEKSNIDDPIGAVPVHGFAGIWGTLSLGLFAWRSCMPSTQLEHRLPTVHGPV